MTEPTADDDPGAVLADPRVDPDQLRAAVTSDGNPLLLVGTVHDHPASVHRVRAVVDALEPEAVAVELPGLAVPLFEAVGRRADGASSTDESADVGEMSAALAAGAAVDAERVGVDTLDVRFARHLLGRLRESSPTLTTLKRVASSVSTVGSHAVSCRVAAARGRTDAAGPAARRSYEYDVAVGASPAEQAADERRQLSRSLSVLRALERPVADAVVDDARERTMARNLLDLECPGGVVAVVGFDHLADVAAHLDADCQRVACPDRAMLRRDWGR